MSLADEKRVYRDSEPAFFEHLECLLDAGFTEIEEDSQLYQVTLGRGEDWTPYFVLRPLFSTGVLFGVRHSSIEA